MTKFVLPSGFITALLLLPLFAPAARAAETIKVVASFSIIADLANQIGGERTEVTALVGPNTDMHVFQPSPIDAKRLRDARVVIINGLGFEGWAPRLAKASGFKGQLVVASKGVKLLRMEDSESHEHAGSGGHGKERSDPHAWQDIANAKIYAANIRDALIAADPDRRTQYERAASAYLAELDALDAEVRSAFAPIL